MKLTLIVLLGLAVCATACKSKSKSEAPSYSGPPAPVTAAEINAAKMNDATVPQVVQNAFARDNSGATINSIKLQSTSAGESYYQIEFLRNGRPGIAQYTATGASVPTAK